jgi:hypothetical protein
MSSFSPTLRSQHRSRTFRTAPGLRLASAEEALQFVNERGMTFFWPIKEVDLPSLWVAAAGDRPVADEHDDPGHITWGWKDGLLGQRRWYYGRIIRHRNAMLSLETVPYFYALSPNFGDPDQDYLDQYEQGQLTVEAKQVYEALLKEGPLDTLALRKAARLSSRESDGRFNKALDTLQMQFRLLPTGVSQAGAWKYAFIYDLTHRHFPNIIEQAGAIFEPAARHHLSLLYFQAVGAAPEAELSRLFYWKPDLTRRVLKPLLESGQLVEGGLAGQKKTVIGLPDLLE